MVTQMKTFFERSTGAILPNGKRLKDEDREPEAKLPNTAHDSKQRVHIFVEDLVKKSF